MKIAVPTRDERVDDHFGHCDHYTIFTIEENKIVNRETMASPQGCGCKSGIAADLQEFGVVMMLVFLVVILIIPMADIYMMPNKKK